MTTILNSPVYISDWLKFEAPSYHSRDTGTLAAGSGLLVSGTVLGKVTATGKYAPVVATATDGSQNAVAVLICAPGDKLIVDATVADQKVVVLSRHADVSHAGLTYDPSISDATKRAAVQAQLAAQGIITREGA